MGKKNVTAKYSISDKNKNKKAVFTFSYVPGETKVSVGIEISSLDDDKTLLDREVSGYPISRVLKLVDKFNNSEVVYSPQLHLRGESEIIKDLSQADKDLMAASVVCEEL